MKIQHSCGFNLARAYRDVWAWILKCKTYHENIPNNLELVDRHLHDVLTEPNVKVKIESLDYDILCITEGKNETMRLAKLANVAWQTLLSVSESSAMDQKVTLDLQWKQLYLASNVGQLCQTFLLTK